MPEKKLCFGVKNIPDEEYGNCIVNHIPPEKVSYGNILFPDPMNRIDPLDAFDEARQKAWIQFHPYEIALLEREAATFTQYFEKTLPNQSPTQRGKKLREFYHIINTMNKVLLHWTGITHDPSHTRIVNTQQEATIKNLTTQVSEDKKPTCAAPWYVPTDFPQPYYINSTLFYTEEDIKKHLTYINFNPVQASVISLYQKAKKRGVDPSRSLSFQNIYISCLSGYMNGVKMLYKTFIMGELIKEIDIKSENIHLLLEEYANQITDDALTTYIQRPGIVLPLQTVISVQKTHNTFFSDTDEVKEVLTYQTIQSGKKKKYDAIAQYQADQELGSESRPMSKKYQKTNDVLKKLTALGYDFSASTKRGFARITDQQTNDEIDCELDVIVYEGNQATWKKVWDDMKSGVMDEVLSNF